jgi:precorrin-2 dehydrogenase / sirohydrochlorin ferrochelatase
MSLFPMFVKLEGRQCLVVGAGLVGETKIKGLLAAGAVVRAVGRRATKTVRQWAVDGQIFWERRKFDPADLNEAVLVVAATSSAEVNDWVYQEAQRRGVLCNSVDDPPHCDFYFPAVVRRGDLQIAISTSGESPAFAQKFRRELEENLDDSWGDWLHEIGALRREILAKHPPSAKRKKLLHLLVDRRVFQSEEFPKRKADTPTSRSSFPVVRGSSMRPGVKQ